MSSQRNIDNIDRKYDERNRIDIIDDKESDYRDQTVRRKENEIDPEESKTDERYHIENSQ